MLDFKQPPPLALYIHIPWCIKKCPYCDFNSHVHAKELPERVYIDTLLHDLEQELPSMWGREIISVFIGGGTPSLLQPESIDRLLSGLRAGVNIKPFIEVTLEANPGTAEQGRFNEFRACGINRLSIGVQSFYDQALKRLGRIHNAAEAQQAIAIAHQAQFDSINIDLMYGLPGQTELKAAADIKTGIALEPQHISHYQLTIEQNTAFYQRPPSLPAEESVYKMQQHCQNEIAKAGYKQYEVSAYAKDGHQCSHNLNYWRFGDYLGIGAGAHQKLTLVAQQQVQRRAKHRLPNEYLSANNKGYVAEESYLQRSDLIFEFMLNALRLKNGFASHLFYDHTGLPISVAEQSLQQAEQQGLLQRSATRIEPTQRGQQYLNELLLLFAP